jgi:hypothetical protein
MINSRAAHFDITKLLYYNVMDNTHGEHNTAEQIAEGVGNWANHCGLIEDSGGYGNEKGKERPAWKAFIKELE